MTDSSRIFRDLACGLVAIAFAVCFVVLALRLKQVQVDGVSEYRQDNAQQSERRVVTAGIRGRILDCHGVVLAGNRPSVAIVCRPEAFQRRGFVKSGAAILSAADALGRALGLQNPLTVGAVSNHLHRRLAMPLTVWRDVGEETLAKFEMLERDHPGFAVEEVAERVYPRGELASHVLGYVGKDFVAESAGAEPAHYREREMVGRSGIEGFYNNYLQGMPGERRIQVNAIGYLARTRTTVRAERGPDLMLTLDADVQAEAESQLSGHRGACAVIDPRNGAVLALASTPGFDPNHFVPVLKPEVFAAYMEDPAKPLLNRAVSGAYAPGSTFKPIVALAALRMGVPPEAEYDCPGVISIGGMHVRCSSRWGHGPVDLGLALKKSCNAYFCNIGMDIGSNAVMTAARDFGIGSCTGLDLACPEASGVVPDGEWKMRTYGEVWYPGDLAQMSIGQGMLLVSPLRMALVAGAIGTGCLVRPHLRKDAETVTAPLPFAPQQLAAVRGGMEAVVAADGTGWRAGEGVPVTVAGKTGTAEIGPRTNRRKNTWFIAYAPAECPTVALAIVIENGESGGKTAAPKAAAILKRIFHAN